MQVTQLVYVSRRGDDLTDDAVARIAEASAARNASVGVTGVLLVSGANLMQLLEGDTAVFTGLFDRIAADPRHADVRQLVRKDARRRLCPEWGMKLVAPRERAALDLRRLQRMIDDIQASVDTTGLTVEARVLLNDFRQQLEADAGGSERVKWIASHPGQVATAGR